VLFTNEVGTRLGLFSHAFDVALDDELGHFGSEKSFAAADGIDSGDEIVHRVAFQDVTERAGIEHLANDFGGVMHGKDEDFGATAAIENLPRGIQSIEARHADVQQGDIGIEQQHSLDGFLAIAGFAHDGPAKLRLKKIAQTEPNNFMVVSEEQP
jgi:hypothetical protein